MVLLTSQRLGSGSEVTLSKCFIGLQTLERHTCLKYDSQQVFSQENLKAVPACSQGCCLLLEHLQAFPQRCARTTWHLSLGDIVALCS